MGKRGPAPLPTEIKRLKGNPGDYPLSENEPKPVMGSDVPAPPEYLGEIGAAEWNRISRTLWLNSCLGDLDLTMFASYCQAFEDWRKASDAVEQQAEQEAEIQRSIVAWELADKATRGEKPEITTAFGALVIQTTNGNVVQNPLVGIKNAARQNMMKAAQQFGLTPSSRVGLDTLRLGGGPAPEREKPSTAHSFLNRGPRLVSSKP